MSKTTTDVPANVSKLSAILDGITAHKGDGVRESTVADRERRIAVLEADEQAVLKDGSKLTIEHLEASDKFNLRKNAAELDSHNRQSAEILDKEKGIQSVSFATKDTSGKTSFVTERERSITIPGLGGKPASTEVRKNYTTASVKVNLTGEFSKTKKSWAEKSKAL